MSMQFPSSCSCLGSPEEVNTSRTVLGAILYPDGIVVGHTLNTSKVFFLEPNAYCITNEVNFVEFVRVAEMVRQLPGGRRLELYAVAFAESISNYLLKPLLLVAIDCYGPYIYSVQVCGIHPMFSYAVIGHNAHKAIKLLDEENIPRDAIDAENQLYNALSNAGANINLIRIEAHTEELN